jgi:hypothetical protein
MRRIALLLVLTWVAASAFSAVVPHIGYVYPAGSRPGETLTVTLGGQFLKDFDGVHLAGEKIPAVMTSYHREFERQEANRIRRTKETFEQKIEEEEDSKVRKQMERQLETLMGDVSMMRMSFKEKRENPAMAKKIQFNPQIAETIKLQIKLPDDLKPGTHELRVITTNGLSNPILFQTGSLKEVLEKPGNDSLEGTARSAETLPLFLNGQIMPGEVDHFRFRAQQGETLVFQVYARSLIPYLADAVPGWFQAVLTLYDANGRELAYQDDFRIDPDPTLVFKVPKDGEYVLAIRDSIYRGRQDFVYRIAMGELPFVDHIFPLGGPRNREVTVQLFGVNLPYKEMNLQTGPDAPAAKDIRVEHLGEVSNSRSFAVDDGPELLEAELNDLPAQAQTVPLGTLINGRIEKVGDVDCFRFEGKKGRKVSLEVVARRLGSPLDARLMLLDPEEHIVAVSDDVVDRAAGLVTHHADASLTYELPATGSYTVRLEDLQRKGGSAYTYRLHIGGARPDFQLRMVPSSLRIPQQGSALVTVHVLRQGGFDGPVELELRRGARGVTLEKTEIPAGSDKVQLIISADQTARKGIRPLVVQGKGRPIALTARRPAVPSEDMMQAFLWRHLVPSKEMMIMITEAEPVTIDVKLPRDGIVRARAGEEVYLDVSLAWHGEFKNGVKLELSDPPEWASLKTKGIYGKRSGVIVIKIDENADTGMTSTLILNGQVRIPKEKDAPDFNPFMKWLNYQNFNFTIDAISVEIID